MDMGLATKIMCWLIGAFAAVMLYLGHVMTGGVTGYKVIQAESACARSGAEGIVINGTLHHVCRRTQK